jgi:hypothetical protein
VDLFLFNSFALKFNGLYVCERLEGVKTGLEENLDT